jgi:hypothetical protein
VEGIVLVVASTTRARKLASSLASFGICLGKFPVASRECCMLDMYILNIVRSMIGFLIAFNKNSQII